MFQFVDFLRKMQKMQRFHRHEGSIPFTRSKYYKGFLTFCISFASGRRFPLPDMLQASCLFPALPCLSRTRALGQFFQGKITRVGCADTKPR
jgi:hypothetical protein